MINKNSSFKSFILIFLICIISAVFFGYFSLTKKLNTEIEEKIEETLKEIDEDIKVKIGRVSLAGIFQQKGGFSLYDVKIYSEKNQKFYKYNFFSEEIKVLFGGENVVLQASKPKFDINYKSLASKMKWSSQDTLNFIYQQDKLKNTYQIILPKKSQFISEQQKTLIIYPNTVPAVKIVYVDKSFQSLKYQDKNVVYKTAQEEEKITNFINIVKIKNNSKEFVDSNIKISNNEKTLYQLNLSSTLEEGKAQFKIKEINLGDFFIKGNVQYNQATGDLLPTGNIKISIDSFIKVESFLKDTAKTIKNTKSASNISDFSVELVQAQEQLKVVFSDSEVKKYINTLRILNQSLDKEKFELNIIRKLKGKLSIAGKSIEDIMQIYKGY